MNNPNPLVPQGSLLEQQSKSKPHLRIAIFIVAIHVVFLGGLLMQGCKRDQPTQTQAWAPTNEIVLPPLDTNITGVMTPPEQALPPLGGPPLLSPGGALPPATQPSAGLPPLDTSPLAGLPSPSVTEAAPPSAAEYTVMRGDTFSSIAQKSGVSLRAILNANPGVDPRKLKVGQKILVPGAAPTAVAGAAAGAPAGRADVINYTVQPRDNLTRIAAKHSISVKELRAANQLKTDRINVGQVLKVPVKKPAMSVEPPPGASLPAPAGIELPPTSAPLGPSAGLGSPSPLGGLPPLTLPAAPPAGTRNP